MKKIIILILLLVVVPLIATACGSPKFETSGEVVSTECNDKGRKSSTIKLDNGVSYYDNGTIGCKINEGTKVLIVHNGDLVIKELMVEGTVRVDDSSKGTK